MRRLLGLAAVVLATAAVLAAPVGASASTIAVTSSAGVSGGPKCALRDAIEAANTNSVKGGCIAGEATGVDLIRFELPSPSTIAVVSILPSVTGSTAIVGPGAAQLTISGSDATRIIETNGSAVTISGLTLAHGNCGFGCGIRNVATLTLEDVVVAHNTATVSGGTNAFPQGGGIENSGSLKLVRSTITENVASAAGASSQNAPSGGGLYNSGSATLSLEDSAVSDNTSKANATPGSSTNASGGGISNFGVLKIVRSTISGNVATATGGSASNGAQGGGINNANSASVKVTFDRATISGNAAVASGASPSHPAGASTSSAPASR